MCLSLLNDGDKPFICFTCDILFATKFRSATAKKGVSTSPMVVSAATRSGNELGSSLANTISNLSTMQADCWTQLERLITEYISDYCNGMVGLLVVYRIHIYTYINALLGTFRGIRRLSGRWDRHNNIIENSTRLT